VLQGAMGTAAFLVALMVVTVVGGKGQDGESIATSFLSGQCTIRDCAQSVPVLVLYPPAGISMEYYI
jgi:hypothetical protein